MLALAAASTVAWLRQRFAVRLKRIRAAVLLPAATVANTQTRAAAHLPERLNALAARTQSALPQAAIAIRLRQRGEMRQSPRDAWLPFEAEQLIALDKVAFLWTARIRLRIGLSVHVIDAYDGESGFLAARLAGILPLAQATGGGIDKGEIQRYLAELAWAPAALTRNAQLDYVHQSDTAVIATARIGGRCASMTWSIDALGRITEAQTDARPRMIGQGVVETPWRGRFTNWRVFHGVELPASGEVEWLLDEGPFLCWRGEIVGLDMVDRTGARIPT